MSLWRRSRAEVAGAWRSLRYDLDRRTEERDVAPAGVPDVTSTGMSTFGGSVAAELAAGYDDDLPRRPRRLVVACAFGALAVAGAAGSYFAVVHGLGSVLADRPAAAEAHPHPLAAEAPPAASSTAGLGRVVRPAAPRAPEAAAAPKATTPVAAKPRRTVAGRVPAPAKAPACDCLTPPVPTPTVAPSASPSASATPSESSSPSPSASESASPSASESAAGDRNRHHRGR